MIEQDKINQLKEMTYNLNLLYVEDDEFIRARLGELFSNFFCNVIMCKDGKEGVDSYLQNKIDLVITDINMPIMDGLSMSRFIKEHNKDAFIIVTTAHSDTDYLLEAIELGINGYLIKPIDTHKLIDTLTSISLSIKARQYIQENIRLTEELKEKNRILSSINKDLERLVQEEIKKRLEQERMLAQQSKMAALGEMLSAITHQWKQPISVLYSIIGTYEMIIESGRAHEIEINELIKNIKGQIEYMNQTIDDFKDFLKPSRYKKRFLASKVIEETINLFAPQAKKYNIIIKIDQIDELELYGYPSELKQAILNLLGNAKDAINSLREIKNEPKMKGNINITIKKDEKSGIIEVCDNGGGIDEDILPKIFEPYFTTKGENGTGIGLVLVKSIIEDHFDGTIKVFNKDGGACFEMRFKLHQNNHN